MPSSIRTHKEDCGCPACRGRRGLAKRRVNLRLDQDIAEWLEQRGAVATVERLVREEKERILGAAAECRRCGALRDHGGAPDCNESADKRHLWSDDPTLLEPVTTE